MNSEIKRAEVTEIINDIKRHSDRLTEFDNIPLLEMSVILSKINRLHESTVILKYLIAKEHHSENVEFSTHEIYFPKELETDQTEGQITSIENEAKIANELEEGEEIIVEMEVDDIEVVEHSINENDNQINESPDVLNETTDFSSELTIDKATEATQLEEGEEIIVEIEVDDTENIEHSIEKPQKDLNEKTSFNPELTIDEAMEATQLEEGEELIVEMEVNEIDYNEEENNLNIDDEEYQSATIDEKIDIQQSLYNEEIENTPDLNEQYAEEEDNSISKQLQEQAIADLISSIGLNERYLYANDLFDGDLEDFKNSLNHINELDNLNQATSYFWEELGARLAWKKDNELVKALYNLVERRFI